MNKRRTWIIILSAVAVLLLLLIYLNYKNRQASPPGQASLTSGGITVTIDYSRPSVRGRIIFGSEQQGALLPYGKHWRLGANEPTTISFNRNVVFNGQAISAGTYWMYAIPGADAFAIHLNTDIPFWGTSKPDPEEDALRVSVATEKIRVPVEQLTISLAPAGEGINMVFEWSDVRFSVPIRAQ